MWFSPVDKTSVDTKRATLARPSIDFSAALNPLMPGMREAGAAGRDGIQPHGSGKVCLPETDVRRLHAVRHLGPERDQHVRGLQLYRRRYRPFNAPLGPIFSI